MLSRSTVRAQPRRIAVCDWVAPATAPGRRGESYRPALTNLGNIMAHMEYGKTIAGCAAALTTHSGRIGSLAPLINDETRRLVNSAYLGARYCYAHDRGHDPAALHFEAQWIGFWFNIPASPGEPRQVWRRRRKTAAAPTLSRLASQSSRAPSDSVGAGTARPRREGAASSGLAHGLTGPPAHAFHPLSTTPGCAPVCVPSRISTRPLTRVAT